MAAEPVWQPNYADLGDEQNIRFGAQCVICDARYATPGESIDQVLVREAIPDSELQQEIRNAKRDMFREFHSAYSGMLIMCYRCQRPACPDCWDDDNQMCGECVAARGLARSPRRGLPSSNPLSDGRLVRVEPGRHSDAQRPTWLNALIAMQSPDEPLGTPPKQPVVKPRPTETAADRPMFDDALRSVPSPGISSPSISSPGASFSSLPFPTASFPGASVPDAALSGASFPGAHSFGVSSPGVSSPGVQSLGMSSPGEHSFGVSSPGMQSFGMSSPGMSSPGMSSPGMSSPGMSSPGMSSPGISSPAVSSPGAQSFGMSSPGIPSLDAPSFGVSSPGLYSPGVPSFGASSPGMPSPGVMERASQPSFPGGAFASAPSYGSALPAAPFVSQPEISPAPAAEPFSPFAQPAAPPPAMAGLSWEHAGPGTAAMAAMAAPAALGAASGSANSTTVECPRCGTSNYDFVTRCTNCRLRLVQNCPQCQQLNAGYAMQCENCGEPLKRLPGWSQVNIPAVPTAPERTRGRGKQPRNTVRRQPKLPKQRKDEQAGRQAEAAVRGTGEMRAAPQRVPGLFEVKGGVLVDYVEAHPIVATLSLWGERILTAIVVIFVAGLVTSIATAELSASANATLRGIFHIDIRQILAHFIAHMQILLDRLRR